MKIFITGGTGFIGGTLVRRHVQRGDQVWALARTKVGKEKLEADGAQVVWGDITARESMREGMAGSHVVYHAAAWYKLGSRDWRKAEEVNVGGTQNVLGLAHELGVPRIVYTSTVAVFGDTHGVIADENYEMPAINGRRDFINEYDRTKWMAHYEVALPPIAQGAPAIIVMPGIVYGPGDRSLFAQIMEAWYRGLFPVFPGPETIYTYAHIADIVAGHILAAENGKPGESYVLAGPALSLKEIAELWARLSGKPAPLAYLPARWLHPLAPLALAFRDWLPGWPELLSADAIRTMGATYLARADKARRELGWEPRPVEAGMKDALDWIAQKVQDQPLLTARQKKIGGLALLAALLLFFRPRKKRK